MGEQPVVPLAPRQPFWGLVVSYWGGGGRRKGVWIEKWTGGREKEGGDEGGGKGREERVMVSFPHMRHRLTPTLYPKKGEE